MSELMTDCDCGCARRRDEEIHRLREVERNLRETSKTALEIVEEERDRLREENEENKQHALRMFRELYALNQKYEQARELLKKLLSANVIDGYLISEARAFLSGEDK